MQLGPNAVQPYKSPHSLEIEHATSRQPHLLTQLNFGSLSNRL
jgi:hypothetical protein